MPACRTCSHARTIIVFALCLGLTASAVMAAENAPESASNSKAPAKIDFNRQIRPILSDKCFRCHGPDTNERQAELRLDIHASALAELPTGSRAIVPGKPTDSELVSRIESQDAELVMPPPSMNKPLSASEKQLLRQWIAEGGDYRQHWSFVPPRRPQTPVVKNEAWVRNPIDRFILARLESEGLESAAAADLVTLCRRVYLDLTGLPPTPEEVEAFLQSSKSASREASPSSREGESGRGGEGEKAFLALVNKLLDSPHYGERMALEWLDAARYADTHGYHIDSHRDMWPWRDWVIAAYNTNMPFDRFTVEQMAGDLLPQPSRDQLVASGFNRNHMINFEGGAIPAEYLNAYIVDRVNTTGTVWMGMSIGCAQCHDHKYDPISQRDFYQLYAFFHNVPENGLDGRKGNASPLIKLPSVAEQKQLDDLAAQIKTVQQQLTGANAKLDEAQQAWETSAAAETSITWQTLVPALLRSRDDETTLTKLDDGSIRASGKNPPIDTYLVAAPSELAKITAVRLEVLPDETLPHKGLGRSTNGNFVLTTIKVQHDTPEEPGKDWPVKIRAASATFSQKDFPIEGAFDGDARKGWAIYPEVARAQTAVFELDKPIEVAGKKTITVDLQFISEFAQHNAAKFRLSITSAENPLSNRSLPPKVRDALAVESGKRNAAQKNEIRDHFRRQVSDDGKQLVETLAKLGKQQQDLEQSVPNVMVMQEMPKPRDTYILIRGQYDKQGEKITAGVPAGLAPLGEDAPLNRLGLAKWLVDPQHPLTARVIVNRYWQMVFGNGLVKTSEDFGSQGEWPSHPELLDWLAREFVESGWNVKHMMRLLVTSAAYRQSSAVSTASYSRDPENRLLARGPRFRLQAELIRDTALAASGLLVNKVGGPSVSPYQPNGIWDDLAFGREFSAQTFVQGKGDELYRRSMYTFWKRTVPPVQMSTFDAPDREVCTVRRARTNTPLQALVLMNDVTYVEASRKLAERVLKATAANDGERLALAYQLLVARRPTDREQQVLVKLLDDQRSRYRADPAAVTKLLKVGESPRDTSLDAVELAAWSTVMSVLLNLDETMTKG